MPKPKRLFETNAKELKWGVTPGGHVAHLIDPRSTQVYKEISVDTMKKDKFDPSVSNYDVDKVSQDMIYNNVSDNATSERFKKIAIEAESLYSSIHVPEEYKEALLDLKTYLLSPGRSMQQDALLAFKEKAAKIFSDNKRNDYLLAFQELTRDVVSETVGDLVPKTNYVYNKNQIVEPSNTVIGKFAKWTKTEEALFPHMPSPNDVKQGYGINDCFLLSPLVRMAENHPERIKKMMKDNMDGTVTGEFFIEDKEGKKQPVYVTVNKTTNKLAGYKNVYASASLWVQMAEKLYIKFLNEYGGKENSFKSINFSNSANYLNAIDGEHKYVSREGSFGFSHYTTVDEYRPNSNTNREYTTYEREFFDFIKKHTNVNKEELIVGAHNTNTDYQKKVDASNDFALSHGVRIQHAYAVIGAFEKDGKMYVQVRDPRGIFRSKYENGVLRNDSSRIMGTFKGGLSNMGTFNLEIKDFNKIFDSFLAMEESADEEFASLQNKWEKAFNEKQKEKEAQKKSDGFDDFVDIESPNKKAANDEWEEIGNDNAPAKKDKEVAEDFSEYEDISFDDIEPLPENKVKVAEKNEVENRPINEKILALLNEPGGVNNMKAYISFLSDDLETTSMFFSYKNTEKFKAMRDKLNQINKEMKDPNRAVDVNKLAADLTELSKAASDYADQKFDSIEKNVRERHEEPSLRAVHRLSDAIMLSKLSDGIMEVVGSEYAFEESLLLVKEDMDKRYEDMKTQDKSPENEKMIERLDHTSKILNDYLEKNPSVNEKAKLVSAHRKMQKKVDREIKAPRMDALVRN